MAWIFWIWGNRGGTIVPFATWGGGFLGAMIANSLPFGWPASGVVGGLIGALVTTGLIVWRALANREQSGEVSYDAQNDRTVVTGENSGTFIFVPVIAWPVLAAPSAFFLAMGLARYAHQQSLLLNG